MVCRQSRLKSEAGRPEEAEAVQQRADELRSPEELAAILFERGEQQRNAGNNVEAIESFLDAVDAQRALLVVAPGDRSLQFKLAQAQMALGRLLLQPGEAIEVLSSAVAILESLVDAEPENADYLEHLGIACHILGDRYSGVDLGRREDCYRRSIALLSELFARQGEGAESSWAWSTFRWSHWNLMRVLSAAGRADEAIECGLQAVTIEETSLEHRAQHPVLSPNLKNRRRLEALLRDASRTDEADAVKQRADTLEMRTDGSPGPVDE